MIIEELLNKKVNKIEVFRNNDDDECILFHINNEYDTTSIYKMYHDQNCCESVYIEDIEGDIKDLEGEVLLQAEIVTNYGNNDDVSETWTFYKFATIKGYVTIRWYGTSNGYYSENVDLILESRELPDDLLEFITDNENIEVREDKYLRDFTYLYKNDDILDLITFDNHIISKKILRDYMIKKERQIKIEDIIKN